MYFSSRYVLEEVALHLRENGSAGVPPVPCADRVRAIVYEVSDFLGET